MKEKASLGPLAYLSSNHRLSLAYSYSTVRYEVRSNTTLPAAVIDSHPRTHTNKNALPCCWYAWYPLYAYYTKRKMNITLMQWCRRKGVSVEGG